MQYLDRFSLRKSISRKFGKRVYGEMRSAANPSKSDGGFDDLFLITVSTF